MPSEEERTVDAQEESLLRERGWTDEQVRYLRKRLESIPRFALFHDLVVSGPACANVPVRDTAAVFRDLVQSATRELVLASYAIYNGRELFQPIIARQKDCPDLKIRFYVDISRPHRDTTMESQIVARYRRHFLDAEWPSEKPPQLFYFKPGLAMDPSLRSSMHAKVIISDRRRAFVTSANLTQAAHLKNIEVGTIFEDVQPAERLANYFEGLVKSGAFVEF